MTRQQIQQWPLFAIASRPTSLGAQKELSTGPGADLLIRTTEGECRAQFDEMAHHLSEQFGEGRAELVMQQLIETSLLPAAKAAASGNAGALSRPPK